MTGKVKVVTPVGELWYCQIAGQGKKNYNEDGYVYTATVHLTGDAAESLKDKIDEVLGEVPKGKTIKSVGYREVFKAADGKFFSETKNRKFGDEDGDEKTDRTAFTFSTNTTFDDGRTAKVDVYNSGKGLPKPKKIDLGSRGIGNGSLGAISGVMERFEKGKEVGVSLFLKAVQITKYIEYSGDAGFDSQEDGDFEDVESDGTEQFAEDTTTEEKPAKTTKAKPRL